jgi:hypothetical protein
MPFEIACDASRASVYAAASGIRAGEPMTAQRYYSALPRTGAAQIDFENWQNLHQVPASEANPEVAVAVVKQRAWQQ